MVDRKKLILPEVINNCKSVVENLAVNYADLTKNNLSKLLHRFYTNGIDFSTHHYYTTQNTKEFKKFLCTSIVGQAPYMHNLTVHARHSANFSGNLCTSDKYFRK